MDRVEKIRRLFKEVLPLYNALGDPIRQELFLAMIDTTPKSVGELTRGTKLSRPTVSFHLKVLREAGIVTSKKVGRNVYYSAKRSRYENILQSLIDEVRKED